MELPHLQNTDIPVQGKSGQFSTRRSTSGAPDFIAMRQRQVPTKIPSQNNSKPRSISDII